LHGGGQTISLSKLLGRCYVRSKRLSKKEGVTWAMQDHCPLDKKKKREAGLLVMRGGEGGKGARERKKKRGGNVSSLKGVEQFFGEKKDTQSLKSGEKRGKNEKGKKGKKHL